MNRKIPLGIAIGLMALAAAATFIITYNFSLDTFNSKVRSVSERESIYAQLSEMDKYVRANFWGTIDEDKLTNSIMTGYVTGLDDRFARFYSAEEYVQQTQTESGITVGLGFSWEKEESGYIKVTEVTAGSSADQAGLVPGDVITAVNNTNVIAYENGYDEAVSLFKCDEGTKVKLHIKRVNENGASEFPAVEVVSERMEIVSVTGRLIDKIAYIKITTFNEKTPDQFKNTLDKLIGEGAEMLIFDIRNNLGGLTDSLQGTLDAILGDSDVVTAYYKDSSEVVVHTTEAEQVRMPMVVIVNGNTASCSELFAFALRDEANAQIVGTTSYGKGVMQKTHKLTGGAAVRITVATLQTKNSGDYNGVGIKPNFEVALPSEVDLSALSEEQQLIYDSQLLKAIEVVSTIN
ncbi:MAG: S41 family peptidase [Ruminococcus sp.]|nr:S41 family peptidase [Ruminococcus sp.]MCM1478608.1 S41 family peptidase [Muribaculaceae bacterium]